MPLQTQPWSFEAARLVRLPFAKLDLEARLECWICKDLSIVGEDLLFLGSQVATWSTMVASTSSYARWCGRRN